MRFLYVTLALSVSIAFHELGHLLVARLLRIDVSRYTLGMGPSLFSVRRKRFIFSFGLIPLGASVEIRGMNPHEATFDATDPRSFAAKAVWRRVLVLLAGSFFNILLAVCLLAALHRVGTHVAVPRTIGAVEPGSEAARAQLRPGDVIQSLEGEPFEHWSTLIEAVGDNPDYPLELGLLRNQTPISVEVTPRRDPSGVGRLGVRQQYVYKQHPPIEAIRMALAHTQRVLVEGIATLARLARGKREHLAATGGESPWTLVNQASAAASSGLDAFLRVLASISLGLAAFYLLPAPALDGGRVLFLAMEKLTKRKVNARLETLLHAIGFGLLVWLIAAVAFRGW